MLADPRLGTLIGGRYRLVSVMGQGGMGMVYRAEHVLLRKEVALKVLHAHLRVHPRAEELSQRFLREAQSLARLDRRHPNIVQIIDCGVAEDRTLYMAMELCEGRPLCEVLGRGPLEPARALHIIVQVLRALVHAHGKGIIHRDLKPDNVMLLRGGDDFVKILDFGIAKLLSETELRPAAPVKDEDEDDEPRAGLTRAGVVFGTPEYLAPEQAEGKGVDQRTDLYAVGVMLWELLVGRRPFTAETPIQTIGLHLTAAPEPPSRHCPTPLPPALDAVVLRAMAKDPDERFASAEEFLRALDVVLEELPRSRRSGRLATGATLLQGLWRSAPPPPAPAPAMPAAAEPGAEAPERPAPSSHPLRPALRRARVWSAAGISRAADRLGVRGTLVLVALLLCVGALGIVGLVGTATRHPHRAAPQMVPAGPVKGEAVRQAEALPPPPLDSPPAIAAALPTREALLDRLEHGRSCHERRSAALQLLARGEPQALEPLLRARRRASGRRAPNACMRRELDDAIARLHQDRG